MKSNKVLVGISGGVDSATSAYLLKNKGYSVVGVFIYIEQPEFLECTSNEDKLKAMKVCAHLKIPFILIDATEEYKKFVINPFVEEYKKGNTPNPDILCNRYIKFKILENLRKEKKFDYIATGHYADLYFENVGDEEEIFLKSPKDLKKDQTYFLWQVPKNILKKAIFPLSKLKKEDVRKIAKQAKLPSAEIKDSTGLCFIGNVDLLDFLSRYIQIKEGDIIEEKSNKIVGRHFGHYFYTIGQRHGFKILNNNEGPFYVTSKDKNKNLLYVSKKVEKTLYSKNDFNIKNLTKTSKLKENEKSFVRYRHTGELVETKLVNPQKILLNSPHLIAKGQSVVFYDKNKIIIGGAIID